MSEPVGGDAERDAEVLDRQIDEVLAGRWPDDAPPAVGRLTASFRVDPPASLGERVAIDRSDHIRRRLLPVRLVAALMAYLFLSHGIGNIVSSAWVAENVGEPDSPHFATEGGLALIVIGVLVGAAARWPQWLPAAAGAAVPLGVAFGVLGVGEIGEFTAGAVLHLSQFGAAVALGVGLWRNRRYTRALRSEGGV